MLLVSCQEQPTKQQEKQVEKTSVQVPNNGYGSRGWKCPYCGLELDVLILI